MRTFIDSVDSLPLLVKVLLAIPALDIIWGIYRIVCALDEKDVHPVHMDNRHNLHHSKGKRLALRSRTVIS